jgi:hypothetical protein
MKEFKISIDSKQRSKALKILSAIDFFIEQQQSNVSSLPCFLDDEWQKDNYRIEVKSKPLGNLITVTDIEGDLKIKFLSNTLIEAHGISDRDCEYWEQIYSCDLDEIPIRENPL